MPSNTNKSIAGIAGNLSKSSYMTPANSLPWGPSIDCGSTGCDIEDAKMESYNLLPSSGYSDDTILTVYDFLEKLVRGFVKELDYKKTDCAEDIFKKLNIRIAKCKKYKEESLELSEKFVNNFVLISKRKEKYDEDIQGLFCEGDSLPNEQLEIEAHKSIKQPENICLGYIYRIVLDIRNESYFHVYLRPLIYTDTCGKCANLIEEEIRNVSFEDLSTSFKILTKDEYEEKIKELFIKNYKND